jgi:hypothetical protein
VIGTRNNFVAHRLSWAQGEVTLEVGEEGQREVLVERTGRVTTAT